MEKHKSQCLYDPHDKESKDFLEFVDRILKENFVDKIISETEKGEKIIGMGKIQERMIPELCQIESSLEMTVTDLVRCKDCKYCHADVPPVVWCAYHNMEMMKIDFCSRGERR